MTWPIVIDISNYDYDADTDEPQWVQKFKDAGVFGVIVGSQWPDKALSQLNSLRVGGLRIVGTYAEPDVESAVHLAQAFGVDNVGLACERGSIVSTAELSRDVGVVRAAGLEPWIYGNRGDLISIAGPLLDSCAIWLANYGMNDPRDPLGPITEMDFGNGPRKLIAHQYNSTTVVAGRVRDHSYFYGQEDDPMEPARLALLHAADGPYDAMLRDYTILRGDPATIPAAQTVFGEWIAGNGEPDENADENWRAYGKRSALRFVATGPNAQMAATALGL